MYLGEHVWSPAAKYYQREFFGDDGWTHPNGGCPALIRITSVDYLQEYSGFDCSVDTGFHLSLPIDDLVKGMDLHWTQDGAGFADHRGRILTFDPAELEQGPNALLARLDSLREFLDRQGLTVCWTIWGMKLINGGGRLDRFGQRLELHGAYFLEAGRPVGFLKYVLEDYRQKGDLRSTLILEQDTAKVSTPTEEPSA